MTLDELAGLLVASRFLPRGEPVEREALRTLPELADGLPAVVFDARGARVWSGCEAAVRAGAEPVVASLLTAARAEGGNESPRDLAGDPFALALAALVVEGARHSPGAAVVPLLEAVRVAHEAWRDPALAAVRADPAALRRVGAAVQARLAVACATAAETVRVPALAWAVARSRLLPVYTRGTLDRKLDWAEVAAVLDIPLSPQTVEAVETATRLAVRGIVERRARGASTPDDATMLLQFLGPARLDPGADPAAAALLLDPDALAVLLPTLGRYVDQKALVAAGVPRDRAERLLSASGGLAVASVLREVLAALRMWDVLGQLVDAVTPAPVRGLGVPRGSPTRAAVVAVGLARLRAEGGAAEAAWEALARAPEGGVPADSTGVVAFPDPVDALRFALTVRTRIRTSAVGLAWGMVHGGTDGTHTRLFGSGVDAALRWVAAPAGTRRGEGRAGGLRSVGGWLAGVGLGIDAAAYEAVQESRMRRGLATAADGPPAGDARVPSSLDLYRACEFEGGVLAMVRIPGIAGGFEALHMASDAWRALLNRDGERATPASTLPLHSPDAVAVAAPAVASAELDEGEGEGWEMAEHEDAAEEAPVTLDLGENTDEPWAPRAAQPGFEFDPDGTIALPEDAGGDDSAFGGFYLPGTNVLPPAAPASNSPPPVFRERPAAFDIFLEDDNEETDEWSAEAVNLALGDAAAPASSAPRFEDVSTDDPVVSLPSGDPFADPVTDRFPDPLGDPEPAPDPDDFAADAFSFADNVDAVAASPAADPFASFAPPPTAAAPPPRRGADPEPTHDRPTGGSRPGGRAKNRPAGALDFDFLLKGYACFFDKREAVFGRPYGTRIVDRHSYPYQGDPDSAYRTFLQDKIREGFLPRGDMVGDLPRGVTLMPLDADKLQRAWKDLS
jgi:hypothetical protein